MTINLSAAPLADVNPYVPAAGITNQQSTFRVTSGVFRPTYNVSSISIYVATTAPAGDQEVTFSVNHDQTVFSDSSGAVFCNSSGNGYVAQIIDDHIRIKQITAGVISGTTIATVAGLAYASGAQFRAKYVIATNTIEVYQVSVSNVTPALSETGLTAPAGMTNGIFADWADSGLAGIIAATIAEGATTSIDTITTGGVSGLKVGSGFSITTTGLGTLTNIEIKSASTPAAKVNAISLSAFAGDGNAIIPKPVIGGYYPFLGTVTVTATDGTLTASSSFTLGWTNYLDTTFAGIVTSDATYLGKVLSDAGHPIVNGDRAYYLNANSLAIGANSSISIAASESAEVVIYIHKLSGIIEAYKLTISESGEIIDIDPLGKQKERRYLSMLYTSKAFYRRRFK